MRKLELHWQILIAIILAAIVAKDLLFRGLYVTQRRLRFEEAVRYRDEQLAQRAGDEAAFRQQRADLAFELEARRGLKSLPLDLAEVLVMVD